MEITLPMSIGEALDKLSILEIKQKYIIDETKLRDISNEITMLKPELNNVLNGNKEMYDYLFIINENIWKLMDQTKIKTSDSEFSVLCFMIFQENYARYKCKKIINDSCDSSIKEIKGYVRESVIYINDAEQFTKEKCLKYLGIYFDDVIVITSEKEITEELIKKNNAKFIYSNTRTQFPQYNIEQKFCYLYDNKYLIDKISEHVINNVL